MATLQTLINNIDYFYEITKIPMFILNKNKIIDHYPQFFFHLPKDCFKYLINSSMTRWGKVGILSSKSDITFFHHLRRIYYLFWTDVMRFPSSLSISKRNRFF